MCDNRIGTVTSVSAHRHDGNKHGYDRRRHGCHGHDDSEQPGIRIHAANWISELLGCIAVGLTKANDGVYQSRDAMEKLSGILIPNFTLEILPVLS